MEFDHVPERGPKLKSVVCSARNGLQTEEFKNEIAKCDIVCANCHRIRTYNRSLKECSAEDSIVLSQSTDVGSSPIIPTIL